MGLIRTTAAAAVVLGLGAGTASAATEVNFILNWIAGGDHAPYYYAKQEGWYSDAGLDVNIEQGKGSTLSAQKTGIGESELGLVDLGTAMVARGKGADLVAVLNVYANSPYGMYWLKSSGISSIDDFAGKKIGNPPWDAARAMWPALAKAVGMEPKAVSWVNIQPNAKLSALKAGSIDITTSFYNIHHIFKAELGDDMGFFAWKEYGINPYGNSILANGAFLKENPDAVKSFVQVSQKAFHFCTENPDPCIDALVSANTGLKKDNELQNWALVVELMTDEHSTTVGLGHFDPERMKSDYDLVSTYFELEQPYDVDSFFTNDYVDTSVKMPK